MKGTRSNFRLRMRWPHCQLFTVFICCSNVPVYTRARWRDCSYRSYIEVVASNIEMCLLPMLRASNNILKGMIYRTSLLHFVSNVLSFFIPAPHAFYFLFPHLSLSLSQEFIQLLSDFAFFLLMVSFTVCWPYSPARCIVVLLSPSCPSSIRPASRFFILFYTKVKLYSISPRKLKWSEKCMWQSKARFILRHKSLTSNKNHKSEPLLSSKTWTRRKWKRLKVQQMEFLRLLASFSRRAHIEELWYKEKTWRNLW